MSTRSLERGSGGNDVRPDLSSQPQMGVRIRTSTQGGISLAAEVRSAAVFVEQPQRRPYAPSALEEIVGPLGPGPDDGVTEFHSARQQGVETPAFEAPANVSRFELVVAGAEQQSGAAAGLNDLPDRAAAAGATLAQSDLPRMDEVDDSR